MGTLSDLVDRRPLPAEFADPSAVFAEEGESYFWLCECPGCCESLLCLLAAFVVAFVVWGPRCGHGLRLMPPPTA